MNRFKLLSIGVYLYLLLQGINAFSFDHFRKPLSDETGNQVGKGVKHKKSVAGVPRFFTRLVISGTIATGPQEERAMILESIFDYSNNHFGNLLQGQHLGVV